MTTGRPVAALPERTGTSRILTGAQQTYAYARNSQNRARFAKGGPFSRPYPMRRRPGAGGGSVMGLDHPDDDQLRSSLPAAGSERVYQAARNAGFWLS